MKRYLVVTIATVVATMGLWTSAASGQGDPTTTTEAPTTTVDPGPTTTVDPGVTTTVDPGPTTTVDPGPTTTSTIPQPAELPGEHVTAGTIELGANFRSEVASTCYMSGSVAGGEINIVKDEAGKIGAVYGKANIGSGDIGLVMVELGPLPMAVTAFRTTGQCNQDVVGIGGYQATPTSATFSSIGYGLFPNDFANNVSVILNVGGTDAGGSLNLQSAYDFLATPRS